MLTRDDQTAAKSILDIGPLVEHPPWPRMKTSGLVAIQPLNPLRRRQSRAPAEVRAHVATILHSRRAHAMPTGRPPLEQPQLLRASSAGANKLRPRAAVREPALHDPDHKLNAALAIVEADGAPRRRNRGDAKRRRTISEDERRRVRCDISSKTQSSLTA
jgi:hypothetical protein